MKKERGFNVSVSYPLINKNDAHFIQSYYDDVISKIESDGTYLNYLYALYDFCSVINQAGVIPFSQWNYNIADVYISQIKCRYPRAVLIIKIAKNIVYAAGCRESLAGLKASNYGNKYSVPFYTFDEMHTMMLRAYDATHEKIEWDVLNDWSTTIIICYLLWLGFSQKEISLLKKEDYNYKFNIIAFENDKITKRRIIDEPEITEYLQRYIGGYKYYLYNDYHGKRPYDYIYSDSLIKAVIKKSVAATDVVDTCCKKFSTYFGFTADDVLLSGRMNRLYYYDIVKHVVISNQNYEAVAECLDLVKPAKLTRNGELGNIISLYPSYKKQRIEHLDNNNQ